MATKHGQLLRGVYAVTDPEQNFKVMYIGSSSCALENLIRNHRNWYKQYGESGRTVFRTALLDEGKKWIFSWLTVPQVCELWDIEQMEGEFIREYNPPLNIDKDPYATSLRRGRY